MNPSTLRIRDTFLLATLGALAAGTLHVSWVLIRLHVFRHFSNSARELPWFSPAIYLACFMAVAFVLALLAMVSRRLSSAWWQGSVFGFLVALSFLLNITTLYPLAQVLLSVGIGAQVGRWLSRDTTRGLATARRGSLLLGLLLFVAGLPDIVLYRLRQPLQLRSLAAAPAQAPNVILLILDTVRAQNLSLYGYARPTTPVLARLGAEGAVFDAAMSTAPWTAPSHSAMLTGRYPFFNGNTYVSPMADSMTTVTEVFRDHGYATGAFMGNAGYGGREMGFDRAFIRYDDYPASLMQALWSATFTQLDFSQALIDAARTREPWRVRRAFRTSRFRIVGLRRGDKNPADVIVDNFIGWRDEIAPRPYFAMLNFIDAHDPYITPNRTRFNGGRRAIDQYDGALTFEDSIIGSLTERLRERGDLDNTILVVTSDHGEHFREHGLTRHGNSLYLELLRVPLLIHAPGLVPPGLRIDRVVSTRDIPRTLLDLAALPQESIPGTSLATQWRAGSVESPSPAIAETERPINMSNTWPTSYGPMKAVVRDSFHYIRRGDGEERTFSWRGDTTGRGEVTSSDLGARERDASRAILAEMFGPDWTTGMLSRSRR